MRQSDMGFRLHCEALAKQWESEDLRLREHAIPFRSLFEIQASPCRCRAGVEESRRTTPGPPLRKVPPRKCRGPGENLRNQGRKGRPQLSKGRHGVVLRTFST